jgi:hypothetical protein
MLRLTAAPGRLCDGPARREFLTVGALGGLGLALPQLLQAAGASKGGRKPTADSCILFYLQGGMSHLDTFDMKPDAPDGIRSPFNSIATRTPGQRVCEYLPKLATLSDRYALIKSMTHKATNHNPGGYVALTGVPPARDVVNLGLSPDDHPNPGAVISKFRPVTRAVPTFVQFSESVFGDGRTQAPGLGAGLLGSQYEPLKITANPNDADFGVEELTLPEPVSAARFARRRSLLQTVESEFPLLADSPELERMDTFYRRAYQLVTSPEARSAFDLRKEPSRLRDRYGRTTYGQSLVLARRLVEAGVRMVGVYWGGLLNAPDDYWDTHKENFPKQKNKLLPIFDQCFSALLEDLRERGLLERTLVIAMGEFGRTPRIGQVTANAGTDATGRDHWPFCYTLMVAGGGIRGGAVVGKSDGIAAYPTERPVAPEDLIATIYQAMGIDHEAEVRDRLNRPIPVTRGEPVTELFG